VPNKTKVPVRGLPIKLCNKIKAVAGFLGRHLVWLWLILVVAGLGIYSVVTQVFVHTVEYGTTLPGGAGTFILIFLSTALIVGAIKRGQLHKKAKEAVANFRKNDSRRWRLRDINKIGLLVIVLMVFNIADKILSYVYLSSGATVREIGPLNTLLFPATGVVLGLLLSMLFVIVLCGVFYIIIDWAWKSKRFGALSWMRKAVIGSIILYLIIIVFSTSVFITAAYYSPSPAS